MLTRASGYLRLTDESRPAATEQLHRDGFVVLPGVFSSQEVAALAADIERVFDELPPDERVPKRGAGHYEPFRYEMLNRSARCQAAIGHVEILSVVEPLLGEDCHVIANTAWRQPRHENDHGGRFWHIDSGPHVPRDPSVPWDPRIPYPVFAVAAHLYLMDCPLDAGPTAVIPGEPHIRSASAHQRRGRPDLGRPRRQTADRLGRRRCVVRV